LVHALRPPCFVDVADLNQAAAVQASAEVELDNVAREPRHVRGGHQSNRSETYVYVGGFGSNGNPAQNKTFSKV
jgi:hypothetical protein